MIDELELYRRNIAELQMQLQNAYKRIEELHTIINNINGQPQAMFYQTSADNLDIYTTTEHDESDDIEEAKKIEATLVIEPQTESEKMQADLEPIPDTWQRRLQD